MTPRLFDVTMALNAREMGKEPSLKDSGAKEWYQNQVLFVDDTILIENYEEKLM